MKKIIIATIGILFLVKLYSQEIPQKISYQGKLLQNNNPINGTKNITFTIGTWNETQNIQITNGLYSATLGKTNPIPATLFQNSNLELTISVEGNNLSPSTEILSVPFAFKAQKAIEAENIFSGNYNDLTNKPNTSTWDTNAADDFSGNYEDLTNKPTIPNTTGWDTDVSDDFSGNYNDLTNKPETTGWDTNASDDFSGNYEDLTNKPTNLSNFTNDAGYITSPNDADADATNEIQTLSISGNDLTISNGNTITLPSSSSNLNCNTIPDEGTGTFFLQTGTLYRLSIKSSNYSTDARLGTYLIYTLNQSAGYNPKVLTIAETPSIDWTFSYTLLGSSLTKMTITSNGWGDQGLFAVIEILSCD